MNPNLELCCTKKDNTKVKYPLWYWLPLVVKTSCKLSKSQSQRFKQEEDRIAELYIASNGCKKSSNLPVYSGRTAGTMTVFCGCGILLEIEPMVKAESMIQWMTILAKTLLKIRATGFPINNFAALIGDRMCELRTIIQEHFDKSIEFNATEKETLYEIFSQLHYYIDEFHKSKEGVHDDCTMNYMKQNCGTLLSTSLYNIINSSICEQGNSTLKLKGQSFNSMTNNLHLFLLWKFQSWFNVNHLKKQFKNDINFKLISGYHPYNDKFIKVPVFPQEDFNDNVAQKNSVNSLYKNENLDKYS